MDNFITLNYLGSFVGMVAVIVLITEFSKNLVDKYLKQIPTKYVVFVYSIIVLLGYQLMTCTFDKTKILLVLINAILLAMTAQGGYEWIFKPIEQKAANVITQAQTIVNNIKPSQGYSEPSMTKPVEQETEVTDKSNTL